MNQPEWILLSYYTDEHLNLKIDYQNIPTLYQEKKGFGWVHLDANSSETKNWLINNANIDPMWAEALLAYETRPRISQIGDGSIIIILRGINLNTNEEPEDMISIRLYINKTQIISCGFRKLHAISELQKKITYGSGPKTTANFLTQLLILLNNEIDPTINRLNEHLDIIEEQMLEKPDYGFRQTIVDLRKQAIIFKRYLAPQREVIYALRHINETWLLKKDIQQLTESHNQVVRYVEDLDSIRERTQIVQDELNNYLTEKLNNNTYKLSIIASIFLPLTFLTGLFGTNIGGIPGSTDNNAFIIFTLALFIVLIIQMFLMKWGDWF